MRLALTHLVNCALLLFCAAWPAAAQAPTDACAPLQAQINQWQEESQQLALASQSLKQLLQGRAPASAQALIQVLSPISGPGGKPALEQQLLRKRNNQRTQLASFKQPDKQAAELQSFQQCGAVLDSWLEQRRQRKQLELSLTERQLSLLALSETQLTVIQRAMIGWRQTLELLRAAQRLAQQPASAEDQGALENALVELEQWRAAYQQVLEGWLPQVLTLSDATTAPNESWQQARHLPRSEAALDWEALQQVDTTLAEAWQQQLAFSRYNLVRAVSLWRNQHTAQNGWTGLVTDLMAPTLFLKHLVLELVNAPINILDSVLAPFLNEYYAYQQQGRVLEGIIGWMAQLFSLAIALWLIILMAARLPAQLATLQMRVMDNLERRSLEQFVSGLFWFFKPNAPWLFVLLSSLALTQLTPDWLVFNWLATLGSCYAFFRAMSIIMEWMISRSYTRSGSFLPQTVAEKIVSHGRHFAWLMLGALLLSSVAIATGGGYLLLLVSVVSIALAWYALLFLLLQHKSACTRFVGESLPPLRARAETAQKEERLAFGILLAPLLFLMAHATDAIRNLNQLLMVFDSYRTLSVKLMRARLETIAEESNKAEEESEPDARYSDWMLREGSPETLFDVGDPEKVLNSLERWYKDASDDNMLLVLGDGGSGKTTFVKRLAETWQKAPARYLRFDQKTHSAEDFFGQIAGALDASDILDVPSLIAKTKDIEPTLLIIDDAHNLFLTEVGCFDAFKALMACMNAQLDNLYLIIVMHAPSWSYLSCAFARQLKVSNIHRMQRWSPQEIRKLILARHEGSGRRLKYNELLLSASASSASSSVRSADSRVFNILWEQSIGNPTTALELWIDAAKVKNRVVEIGVPQKPSAAPLNAMPDDFFFIYAALVVHRSLSTKELMKVTHFAEAIVRHAIKQGVNLGLIVRDDTQRYAIDSYWYSTLSAVLQRKNLIW